MSEPIVEPAAQAAAPTAPAVSAPETTPAQPTTPPEDGMAKRAASLVNLLTQPSEDPTAPKKKIEPKSEPKPESTTTAPATEPKKEKSIKVRKAAEPAPETRPPLPTEEPTKAEPAKPTDAVAAKPAAPVEDDATFEAALFEEEKALLEDARAAEKLLGKKYEGQAKKTLAFLKESAAKEKELQAEVKSGEMTEADMAAAFKEWYDANLPQISPVDVRAIERARAKEEAVREIEPKLQEERHARWVETEAPKIEAKGVEIKRQLWNEALPEEVTKAADERLAGVTDEAERQKIIAEVKQDYALELEVTENITAAARDDIQEFYRLMAVNPATNQPLKKRNFDLNTPEGQQHDRIAKMAHGICEEFKTTGGTELKKDGKWFATWAEWAKMTPAQQAGWWTFSNDELIARARINVKKVVAEAVKQQRDYLEGRGFKRVIPTRTKPATPPPATQHAGSPPAPRIAPPPAGPTTGVTSQAERLTALVGGTAQ